MFKLSNWKPLLLIFVSMVVLAKTYGPIQVYVYGGNNAQNSAVEDAELGWVGAQTAAKVVLGGAMMTGSVKRGDNIEFIFFGGERLKLKYMGGYPGTLLFNDPTGRYSSTGDLLTSGRGCYVYYTYPQIGFWEEEFSSDENGNVAFTSHWNTITFQVRMIRCA